MAGSHNSSSNKTPRNSKAKTSGQMIAAVVGTVVAAAIIFGGGAYLFTRLFTGSFHEFDESNSMTLVASEYKTTVDVSGTIQATSSVSVSPETEGVVNKVLVKDGDKVKKGDTLFTMTSEAFSKAQDSAESAYSKAVKAQDKAQDNYDKATDNVTAAQERLEKAQEQAEEKLKADPEFVFDTEPYDTAILTAQDAQDAAKDALDTAKSNTSSAESDLSDAIDQLSKLTVTASKSGTVADLIVEKGMSSATINSKGAAMRIIDLDSLMGVVQVPEDAINSITVGQECKVNVGTGKDAVELNAAVYKIADTPSKKSSGDDKANYSVQLTLDDLSSKVKYGMSITANLELRDYGTVYYVPTSAVSENGNGAFVEVIYNDHTTKEHSVTVLDTTEDGQAIIQGNTLSKDMKIRSDLS